MDGFLLRYNKNIKYCILDTETYNLNLNFCFNRCWQVGILNVIGENIISEKDIRISWKKDAPNLSIGADAARITRFNQEEHDKIAINPRAAFELFWPDLINCDYILGHNLLAFDLYLLKGYAEFMGVDWKFIIPKIIDTKAIAQGIKMNIPFDENIESFIEYQYKLSNTHVKGIKTNLGVLGKEYGIDDHDFETLHSALSDIKLNLKVWNKMKYQLNK